jgi:hypothetical protein
MNYCFQSQPIWLEHKDCAVLRYARLRGAPDCWAAVSAGLQCTAMLWKEQERNFVPWKKILTTRKFTARTFFK